jgi:site-specific DNA-methyltransferase (adenine-specific)
MGKFNSQMLSQNTNEWATPKVLFDKLNKEFNFTLDACASSWNNKVDNYFSLENDALQQDWKGVVWCNPPYSNVSDWVKKAYEESEKGAVVVMLIFSKTDTKYFHNFVMKADEIRFIKGRVKFEKHEDTITKSHSPSAPAPSCVVVFRNNNKQSPTISSYVWR